MKIFLLLNDYLGGAENVLLQLSQAYKSKGHDVKVFVLGNKQTDYWSSLDSDNFKVLYFNKKIRTFLKALRYQNKYEPMIFTTHVYLTGFVGFFTKLGFIKKRSFVARESTQIFARYKGLKLFTYKICYYLGYPAVDLLICQTSSMKTDFIKSMPFLKKRINIKVIPNPFNSALVVNNEKFIVESVSSIDFIVTAGRFIQEKGFDFLINAFKVVRKSFPELKLVILGEGALREKLEEQILNLDLKNHVVLPGFVSNVYPYFKKAKVCVVSSRIEGFPNILLQMMSQNTKVVSTFCAGDIDKLKGVMLVPIENVNKLAESIILTLQKDTSLNRVFFDKELESRSVNNFINNIEISLQNV